MITRLLPALGLLLMPSLAFASFTDVSPNHPNAEAIHYLQEQGVVSGYADGSFRPEQAINRAEFLKIVLGAQAAAYTGDGPGYTPGIKCFFHETQQTFTQRFGTFTDIDFDSWYAPFFCNAVRSGVVGGYPDHTFRPGNRINFVEAAKIIVKTLFGNDVEFEKSHTETWYAEYVFQLTSNNAVPLSITHADQQMTRGDMAEILYRLATGDTGKSSRTYEELLQNSNETMSVKVFIVQDVSGEFSYIPVSITVPKSSATLKASLQALFDLETPNGCYDSSCMFRSEFYLSRLHVDSATIVDGVARVKITGDLSLAGDTSGGRAVEQVERTVRQFPAVRSMDITINGSPLKCLRDLSGMCGDMNSGSTTDILLYFGVVSGDCGLTQAVTRYIPKTSAVADATLRLLFAGPTQAEESIGAVSSLNNKTGYYGEGIGPLADYYKGISIVNGIATVKFSGAAMAYLNNTACTQEAVKKASIERTLLQFPSIHSIQYSVDGKIITEWDA